MNNFVSHCDLFQFNTKQMIKKEINRRKSIKKNKKIISLKKLKNRHVEFGSKWLLQWHPEPIISHHCHLTIEFECFALLKCCQLHLHLRKYIKKKILKLII